MALISQPNYGNKIKAYHTNSLLVIIYPAGIISWPHEWIDATDVKTWMSPPEVHHPVVLWAMEGWKESNIECERHNARLSMEHNTGGGVLFFCFF